MRIPKLQIYKAAQLTAPSQLDKLVGLAMLVASSVVFLYYTVWTLLMVCTLPLPHLPLTYPFQPFHHNPLELGPKPDPTLPPFL
jgi:hypothetical protein